MSDFRVQGTDSNFVLLHPVTAQAWVWVKDHIADDQTWFGDGLVVEHRYVEQLFDGIEEAGFTLS